MFNVPMNYRTITLELKRIDVLDLMIACTTMVARGCDNPKWIELHDKLRSIIDDFDSKEV